MSDLFLGGPVDAATGDRDPALRTEYEAADLTTHGVIVGMTGSGKTGLGVIYLEEALRNGIPVLALDPKGDMTNLLLTFPDLATTDFAPWIDPAEAARDEMTVEEKAAATASLWREGLAGWGLTGADIADLRSGADFTIYTPGSAAGVPVNIVGSLDAPPDGWEEDVEGARDEIQAFASGLLGLIGVEADPISSREHILIATLIEHGWRTGTSLDMARLLAWIQQPPIRKLGVFDVDSFFPAKNRTELAMRLNGLLASPAFASWMEGAPLDIEELLWKNGKPRAAVVYLAHLSDEERQFVVTLILSKLISWMRTQPGSGELRALVYMDEVYGFAPPTAEPPAKKPILTLLKQARAFGVGLLLSTQNPVDLDYKAMSNAGTWCIGRLQTERDKARLLEALASASGDADVADLDTLISALEKRRFLLHNTRRDRPQLFTTRWAMSYLRGPLTRTEITRLMETARLDGVAEPPVVVRDTGQQATGDEVPMLPGTADGVPVYHLDPAAPWADRVGAGPGGRYEAAIAARVMVRYDDRVSGVDHQEVWEAVFFPPTEPFAAATALRVDYDDRDLRSTPPESGRYRLPDAPIGDAAYLRSVSGAIRDHLDRTATISVLKNRTLKLYSRVGETAEEFAARCDAAADDAADRAAAALRDKYETKITKLRRHVRDSIAKADTAAAALDAEQRDQMMDQAGALLSLLTGRGRARSLGRSSRAARSAEQRLRTAEDRVEATTDEIADVETELADELSAIVEEWDRKAEDIEVVAIGLERDDIDVAEVAIVWIPTAD